MFNRSAFFSPANDKRLGQKHSVADPDHKRHPAKWHQQYQPPYYLPSTISFMVSAQPSKDLEPHYIYEIHQNNAPNCFQAAQQRQQVETSNAEERAAREPFACKRCPARFISNTKLHQHIRDRHAKRPKLGTSEAPTPAPITASTTPPFSPPTSLKTLWAAIAAKLVSTPKPSRLPMHVVRTPPLGPPQSPDLSHH